MQPNDKMIVRDIAGVVQARYPSLTIDEAREVVNTILNEIAERLSAGQDIAFIRADIDNSTYLDVFRLEDILKKT